jgi:hypothetical protein
MDRQSLIEAGKAPRDLFPWRYGLMNAHERCGVAHLSHVCVHGLHTVNDDGYGGYTVMEDSDAELSRHLQAVKFASGRILKTGLGLGCFVRMCLTKEDVQHIDVVEIDASIATHFGAEFKDNPRVKVHLADALTWDPGDRRWDLAWHDIYCAGNEGLQHLHMQLITRYQKHAQVQGAWNLPRWIKRLAKEKRKWDLI